MLFGLSSATILINFSPGYSLPDCVTQAGLQLRHKAIAQIFSGVFASLPE